VENAPPSSPRYFEDFAVGMSFVTETLDVSREDIVRFASEFDPQPFHVDPDAAANSFFGTLVASGWHTAALTMRLMVGSPLAIAGGIVGAGGEIKWPAALLPGDRVHVAIDITATRALRTRPTLGMITTRARTTTQRGDVVQELSANLFVPRRVAATPEA
jgi:acyl dehydratase